MKLINILEKLKEPPKKFRPFVRWWWFGGGITKKEIAREMEMMDNQGIGGVEIQYLYEALEGSPLQHLDKIEWLSKDWVDLVRYAVKKGKELGLQIDLTFGNGWPFGGPHIDEKHASTKLASYSMPLGFQEEKLEIPLEDLVQSPEDIVCILAMELDEKNKLTGKSID